jgi:predicted ArsR family transcriptional regulator
MSEPTNTYRSAQEAPAPVSHDESAALPRADTRRMMLEALKRQGPLSAKQLARNLGITVAGVRQHLVACEQDGIVSSEARRHGPGRPSLLYSLTEHGQHLFGQRYERLALDLLDAARRIGGTEMVERLFEQRYRNQLRRYLPAAEEDDVRAKVQTLARLREGDGYMAEAETDGAGRATLIQHHCPILSVASAYPNLCACELRLFGKILGPGMTVERTEHMIEGDRACRFSVKPSHV